MRIRFNNFFKFKIKENKEKIENVSNSVEVKEPALKVYSGGGQVIKYETYKTNDNVRRRRKGAENIDYLLDSSGSDRVKINEKCTRVVEKYKENSKDSRDNSENMRKVKRRKNVGSGNRRAYLLFGFMVILAGYSLYFAYSKYNDLNQEDYAVYNSEEVVETVIIPSEQSSISNNLDTIRNDDVVKTSTNVSNNTTKTQVPKVIPLNFGKPLEGEILKIYSKDKVIYSKTLELWKTHDGIDIKADENAIVKAVEKGTVEKIYDDSFYGKTIVIDHGQGYKSSYSNLSDEVFVKEKQVVTKLAKIGKVGKTAIGEIKDESHLHFMLIKNNEICDPSSIFN